MRRQCGGSASSETACSILIPRDQTACHRHREAEKLQHVAPLKYRQQVADWRVRFELDGETVASSVPNVGAIQCLWLY